jgi:hypothetical protein
MRYNERGQRFPVMKIYASVLSGNDDLDFSILGGPLEAPEDHIPLFAALGFAAAAWARMEQQLDIVLIHVNKEKLSSHLYQPQYPFSFDGKIKLAKRWFNQHPQLASYSEDIRHFTSSIKPIARIRNSLLHSILQEWDPIREIAIMQTVRFEGEDNFRVLRRNVSLETIRRFGAITNAGNKFLSRVTVRILTDTSLRT